MPATLIGESAIMRTVTTRISRIAEARRTTLICGPTGSGKEVVAERLHRAAHDASAPFVPVHCGALPEHLVESELFGHTRGAFTGATQARDGLIPSAAGGTLFLDEIDSLSLAMQAKLLRFLEDGEYRSVGCDQNRRASVWVLAATNCDLRERVASRTFREDLYFRLDVLRLDLPALRHRGGDIELLADYFLDQVARGDKVFSASAIDALRAHEWPGNVRELKHRVERAALLGQDDSVIHASDLGLADARRERAHALTPPPGFELWHLIERDGLTLGQALTVCERRLIEAALTAENNNRTRAAARLGIHVRTIFKKLSR